MHSSCCALLLLSDSCRPSEECPRSDQAEVEQAIENFKVGCCNDASEHAASKSSYSDEIKFSKGFPTDDWKDWLESEFKKLLQDLGFSSYSVKAHSRGNGVAQVDLHASWAMEPMNPPKKLLKGHEATCAVCHEKKSMIVLAPCGHVICRECKGKQSNTAQCPFCRQKIDSVTEGLFFS